MGTLRLIPWHIGDAGDAAPRAAKWAETVGVLLTERPDLCRRELRASGISVEGREIWELPPRRSSALAARVLEALATTDVGVFHGRGTPCVFDPGHWLVEDVRRAGGEIRVAAGPSVVAAAMALSGEDLSNRPISIFHCSGRDLEALARIAASRADDVVFLFPEGRAVDACLAALAREAGDRLMTVFVDLTKPFPRDVRATPAKTLTCRNWAEGAGREGWPPGAQISLMLRPAARKEEGARTDEERTHA